jgi:hypothetical protein
VQVEREGQSGDAGSNNDDLHGTFTGPICTWFNGCRGARAGMTAVWYYLSSHWRRIKPSAS